MSLEVLVSKYIASAEKVLLEMQRSHGSLTINEASVSKIVDYIADYLADAKYYKAKGKLETSLTSVAYCEGLLDALRLLGAVKFEWPEKPVSEE
jgi:FAD synthetase